MFLFKINKLIGYNYYSAQSLDVEEDDDAGDIIYRSVFLLPSLHSFPNQCFGGLLSAIILIMGHDNINSLIV